VRHRLRIALVAAVLLIPGSAWADSANYITSADADLVDILPPPPVPGSPQDIADMKAVMDAQKARTPADVEAAEKDFKKSIFRFRSVLGPDFSAKNLPFTDAFFALSSPIAPSIRSCCVPAAAAIPVGIPPSPMSRRCWSA
jgi:hypothetical protein